jgi:hypothetical protein
MGSAIRIVLQPMVALLISFSDSSSEPMNELPTIPVAHPILHDESDVSSDDSARSSDSESQHDTTTPRAATPPRGPDPPPVVSPPAVPSRTFSIAWAVRALVRTKRHIRLCENDAPVYFARGSINHDSHELWLVTEQDVEVTDPASPLVCGHVMRENRTRRWTFRERDVPGDLFGLAFYDISNKKFAARAFRIVMPRAPARPYQSTTKETELSWLAKIGRADRRFKVYSSKIPARRGSAAYLNFGTVHVEPSLKNFIVEGHHGSQLFIIFRSSSGTCTVRAAPPFTPLMAFALAIAIVTTDE